MNEPTALDRLGTAIADLTAASADLAALANAEDDYLTTRATLCVQQAAGYARIGHDVYLHRLRRWAHDLRGASTMAAATTDPLAALTARQAAIHEQHAATQAELAALRERRAGYRTSVAVLEPAGREAQGIEQTEAEIAAAERRLSRFDAALAEVAAELAEETARQEAERRAGLARQRAALIAERRPIFTALERLLSQYREQVQTGLDLSQQIAAIDAALGECPHPPLFPGGTMDEAAQFALDVAAGTKAALAGVVGGAVNVGAEPLPAAAPIQFAATRG